MTAQDDNWHALAAAITHARDDEYRVAAQYPPGSIHAKVSRGIAEGLTIALGFMETIEMAPEILDGRNRK